MMFFCVSTVLLVFKIRIFDPDLSRTVPFKHIAGTQILPPRGGCVVKGPFQARWWHSKFVFSPRVYSKLSISSTLVPLVIRIFAADRSSTFPFKKVGGTGVIKLPSSRLLYETTIWELLVFANYHLVYYIVKVPSGNCCCSQTTTW